MPEGDEHVRCASYTFARRHPMVLGRIAGWAPPFQLSLTQIGVLVGTFWLMISSWRLWSPWLPDTVAMMTAAGLPAGACWAVRRVRVEGRSLPRAAVGFVTAWAAPANGAVAGRPARTGRAVPAGRGWTWLGTG